MKNIFFEEYIRCLELEKSDEAKLFFLENKIAPNYNNSEPFIEACIYGNLDLIMFFLEDSRIENIKLNESSGYFETLVGGGRLEIISYLLYRHNLQITDEMLEVIHNDGYHYLKNAKDIILDMIKNRDLFFKLKNEIKDLAGDDRISNKI